MKLQTEEQSLTQVLAARIREAKEQERNLKEQQRICTMMQNDGVTYQNLRADLYLSQFGKPDSSLIRISDPVEKDQEYRYPYSWRRFFARQLALMFYGLLIDIVFYVGFRIMPLNENWFNLFTSFAAIGLMYILEPFFLHYLATTPGKFLLGIKVFHVDGRKLTLAESRSRVGNVLCYGMGLNIPIFCWYRLWKSYRTDQDGEMLPWEEEASAEIAPINTITFLLIVYAQYPIHREDLTTAELADNSNRYLDHYDLYTKRLDENCNWQEMPPYDHSVVIAGSDWSIGMGYPQLEITEETGDITEVSFHVRSSTAEIGHGYQDFILLLMQAYGGAQRRMHPLRLNEMQKLATAHPYVNYSQVIGGLQVTYKISYEGYYLSGDTLYSDGNAGRFIDVYFSMKKVR